MATRRPLVRIAGRIVELPASDTLPGTGGGGSAGYYASETPPDPALHPLWFDLATGAFLSWVDDGTSAQWLDSGGSAPFGKRPHLWN
jgi:hypothetical protein